MLYYCLAGGAYAPIWLMNHAVFVDEQMVALDNELKPDERRLAHIFFTATMFATITVVWPWRLYRDLKEN